MVKIRDKLAEYGLAPTPFNIAIGLTVFQGLSCVSTFGGWALCYKLLGRPVGTRLLARFDQYPKYTRTITWCQSKIEKSRYIVPFVKYCVPSVKNWNGEKLLVSCALSQTIVFMCFPLLVPMEVAGCIYAVQTCNRFLDRGNDTSPHNSEKDEDSSEFEEFRDQEIPETPGL